MAFSRSLDSLYAWRLQLNTMRI